MIYLRDGEVISVAEMFILIEAKQVPLSFPIKGWKCREKNLFTLKVGLTSVRLCVCVWWPANILDAEML